MPGWPSTLRARLTLWYTLWLAVPLVSFAVFCYVIFSQTLESRTDRFIDEALTAFSREVVAERRMIGTTGNALRSAVTEVRFRDLRIVVRDSTGGLIAESGEGSNPPPALESDWLLAALRDRPALATTAFHVAGRGSGHRVVSRILTVERDRFGLTGAFPLNDVEEVLARIRRTFLLAVPFLIVCAATAGYVLAKRSLAPVASMAERAAEISATTLHERLPVEGGDELVRLARVVNDLLDRLEGAFTQQRRFMADASHELRTPTAILRAEAEVTLSREHRTEEEYRESVTVMQDAAHRLNRIVDDLFLIGRADAGHLLPNRDALYLEELVHVASRAVRHVAEQRQVKVEVHELVAAPILGDATLLDRLLLNLLDNAIKYAPPGSSVDVTMATSGTHCSVSIIDAGRGIPQELHRRVFERFFRVDSSRVRDGASATSGAGLGLAIAQRIAEMHDGTLAIAESRPGRTEFRLTLPLA
ncbi:MAG: HAMP domain-containing protein [Cytophagaceae bacterium]|nr:HAMP domain-containing protein [Gemmatimonadaceae bacterium]